MENIKPYSLLNQVAKEKGAITWAEYPIFEWVVPINRLRDTGITIGKDDCQAPFAGEQFVLNIE